MKKTFIAVCLIFLCLPIFAGGKTEFSDLIHPDTVVYTEITNPEALISQSDSVFGNLGLLQIAGIGSFRQEISKSLKNADLEFVDLSKPIGICSLGNENPMDPLSKEKTIIVLSVKGKKEFEKLKASLPTDKGLEIKLVDNFAVISDDPQLIAKLPYKKPMDISALKRRDENLLSICVNMQNTINTLNKEDIKQLLKTQDGPSANSADNSDKIIDALFTIREQSDSLTIYLNLEGPKIAADLEFEFIDGTKADEFILGMKKGKDVIDLYSLVPQNYIGSTVMHLDPESMKELSSMSTDLYIEDKFSQADKQRISQYIEEISNTLTGDIALAFDMDSSGYMQFILGMTAGPGLMSYNNYGGNIMDIMGLEAFGIARSSDPKKARDIYCDYLKDPVVYKFMAEMENQGIKYDYDIKRNIKISGIDFDEISYQIDMSESFENDAAGMSSMFSKMEMKFYLTDYKGMLLMAYGSKARRDAIDLIKNNGTLKSPLSKSADFIQNLKEIPADSQFIANLSISDLLSGMMSSFMGAFGGGTSMAQSGPGIIAYGKLDGGKAKISFFYDLSEIKEFMTIIGLLMQFGGGMNDGMGGI